VKLEKSSGFSEWDVVFASEVAKLIVLGSRDHTPVGSTNLLLVIGHVPSSKSTGFGKERAEWSVVSKKLPTKVSSKSGRMSYHTT
jgi:hypothetical protein